MKMDLMLYWKVSSANANDAEVLQVTKATARRWDDGDTLLWDRLGTTRRTRNPSKQHFNPEALGAIRRAHGETIRLPFKGKYLIPCELLSNDLKSDVLGRTPKSGSVQP